MGIFQKGLKNRFVNINEKPYVRVMNSTFYLQDNLILLFDMSM